MEIRISIGERSLMLILAVITAVSAVGLALAYGGNSPSTVGHSWGEIYCDKCIGTSNISDSSVTGAKIGCDSTLCRNSINGNFGIGTASPAHKLEVNGDIYGSGGRADCGTPSMEIASCRSFGTWYLQACDFRVCNACGCSGWNPGGTQIIRAAPGA